MPYDKVEARWARFVLQTDGTPRKEYTLESSVACTFAADKRRLNAVGYFLR
jgi:hypothetical protein